MNTKIIALTAILKRIGKYRDIAMDSHLAKAAWNMAHTFLWPGKEFSPDEINHVTAFLQHYFEQALTRKKAFINFCERIILASKLQKQDRLEPAIWFNAKNTQGFAATQDWHRQIARTRIDMPGYLRHFTILAKYYYQYMLRPSARIFRMCRKNLLKLKANNLLQHFNNIIVHYHYLVP